MMAADISRALDPVLLAHDCGIVCDPWQAGSSAATAKADAPAVQSASGQEPVSALLALHTALYVPNALVLLVSPSLRQSSELFRTVMGFHAKLKDAPRLEMESTLRAEFGNGSRIISLPGSEKTTRGYSKATLVVVDEAARVEDALMASLRPMLATSKGGGKMVLLSTPFGKRGAFYEYWSSGGEDWHRVEVPASSCPRISQEFLDEEMRQLGAQKFSEEYGLQWLDPTESVFPEAIISAAFTPEVTPLW